MTEVVHWGMGSAGEDRILQVGAPAPGFRLRKLDGGHASLAELLPAGPLLLAFFKVSCPVCQLTLPFLERIHQAGTGSFAVYGISQDEAKGTRDFNRRFGITFPTLLDTSANQYEASDAFRISTVPTLFLIARDGTISWTLEGFAKRQIGELASQAGLSTLYHPGEYVPEWKAG